MSSLVSKPRVLKEEDVHIGKVIWLPTYGEAKASFDARRDQSVAPVLSLRTQQPPNNGFYNHPILILWRSGTPSDRIHFLLVSDVTA